MNLPDKREECRYSYRRHDASSPGMIISNSLQQILSSTRIRVFEQEQKKNQQDKTPLDNEKYNHLS